MKAEKDEKAAKRRRKYMTKYPKLKAEKDEKRKRKNNYLYQEPDVDKIDEGK